MVVSVLMVVSEPVTVPFSYRASPVLLSEPVTMVVVSEPETDAPFSLMPSQLVVEEKVSSTMPSPASAELMCAPSTLTFMLPESSGARETSTCTEGVSVSSAAAGIIM